MAAVSKMSCPMDPPKRKAVFLYQKGGGGTTRGGAGIQVSCPWSLSRRKEFGLHWESPPGEVIQYVRILCPKEPAR